MARKNILLLVFFCFFNAARADEVANTYIEKANELELHRSRTWLTLLHYKNTAFGTKKSIIISKNYFLAKDGRKNAKAEMEATINGFYSQDLEENETKQHPICQFPARFDYLNGHLKFKNLPKPKCKKYGEFMDELKPDGLSIIFPTTYMNNPASMFGHTLIRIDKANSEKNNTDINSFIVNYGANTGGETNGIRYAFKGVFGLYPGFFSVMPYYKMTNDYNNLENRDIWEYRLSYTKDEAVFYSKHVWELVFADMRYYFFKENCSYLMLESLEVIRPDLDLTGRFILYTAPIDTVKIFDENGMVVSKKYRPSLQKQIQNNIPFLTHGEIKFIKKYVKDEGYVADVDVENSDLTYETAYNWLKYRKVKSHMDADTYRRQSLKILKNVRGREGVDGQRKIEEPVSPDLGHGIGKTGLSFGRFRDQNYLQFNIKPVYHELIDSNEGFDAYSEISFLNFSGRYYFGDEKFRLDKLDFIKIKSFAVQDSFFKPVSFSVLFGVENLYDDFDVLMLDLNGGITLGNKYISTFFLVGPKVNYSGQFDHDATFGMNSVAGAFLNLRFVKLIADFKVNTLTDPRYNYNQLNVESNLILNKNFEINLSYRRYFYRKFDNANDFSVGFRILF